MLLSLDQIKRADKLQPRIMTDMFVIDEYTESMRHGTPFPPVDVVYDGETYWLWDGFHRTLAAEKAGLESLEANITDGTRQDAEWLALSANKTHGKQRSNADKRRAIRLAFEHPKGLALSDLQIANHVGVSHHTVARCRQEIELANPVNWQDANIPGTSIRQTSNGHTRLYQSPTTKIDPFVRQQIALTDLAEDRTELTRLARLEPNRQMEVVDWITDGDARNVKDALRKIERESQIIAIQTTPIPQGKYHVIAADYPWAYDSRPDDITHRAANPYPTMTIEQIKADPTVNNLALNDCVMWFWTTNAFMKQAYEIVEGWGWEVKTILTWVKDRMGTGDWLRGQTEHCLMCIKGHPLIHLTNQTTVIHGPMREHSRKPDSFYELVDQLCPGKKIEMFAREKREGWSSFGNEVSKFNGSI